MKLGQSQTKNARKAMKFECEKFSCFSEERETLFFGGVTELRIKGIIQYASGGWKHYDKYMEPINAFKRMTSGLSLRGQVILDKKLIQLRMNIIIKDHLQNLLSVDEKNAPFYVSSLVSYQMSSTKHVRLLYNELESAYNDIGDDTALYVGSGPYEWIRCIVAADDGFDEYFDLANIAVLYRYLPSDIHLSHLSRCARISKLKH